MLRTNQKARKTPAWWICHCTTMAVGCNAGRHYYCVFKTYGLGLCLMPEDQHLLRGCPSSHTRYGTAWVAEPADLIQWARAGRKKVNTKCVALHYELPSHLVHCSKVRRDENSTWIWGWRLNDTWVFMFFNVLTVIGNTSSFVSFGYSNSVIITLKCNSYNILQGN